MVSRRPTSLGLFSKSGRICLRLAFPASEWVCAAALRTESVFTNGDVVGRLDFEIIEAVELATPEYFCD